MPWCLPGIYHNGSLAYPRAFHSLRFNHWWRNSVASRIHTFSLHCCRHGITCLPGIQVAAIYNGVDLACLPARRTWAVQSLFFYTCNVFFFTRCARPPLLFRFFWPLLQSACHRCLLKNKIHLDNFTPIYTHYCNCVLPVQFAAVDTLAATGVLFCLLLVLLISDISAVCCILLLLLCYCATTVCWYLVCSPVVTTAVVATTGFFILLFAVNTTATVFCL